MSGPPPVIAALPVSGLVSNLICDDGSLDLTNPQGNLIVIRAKVIAATATTPPNQIGIIYTNGPFLRQVTVVVRLTTGGIAPGTLVNFQTVIGGDSINLEGANMYAPASTASIDQLITFQVDANAHYGLTEVLNGGTVTVVSWLEVDVT
jgi:hypothetical protein